MKKNIDLENSSYIDLKNMFSNFTFKSWAWLLSGLFTVIITLSAVVITLDAKGFIDLPWVGAQKTKENNSVKENSSFEGMLVAKYGAHEVIFRGGYLHKGNSTVQSCLDDYKKSFNEVGAEINNKLLDSAGNNSGLVAATLNGHDIYAYCYTTASNKINSHAILFANGEGAINGEAQKAANLAGVNLDSVISHLKNVEPL